MQNEQKKGDNFKFKVFGGFSDALSFVSSDAVGFWGFTDPNLTEKQIFGGYFYGLIMSYRISENFDAFLDISILRSSLLMGKAGNKLKGIAVWDADPNHISSISPPLPNDIYFVSKAMMGRIGARFIYPINEIIEPNAGLVLGIVPYEIAFGNFDGSRAYSEIVNDIASIFAFIFGIDFNIYAEKEKLITLGLFTELNGSVTETGTEMHNWIWKGWTYHAQFPVVPHFRYGLNLSFNF